MLGEPLGVIGPAVGVQVPQRPQSWKYEEDGCREERAPMISHLSCENYTPVFCLLLKIHFIQIVNRTIFRNGVREIHLT